MQILNNTCAESITIRFNNAKERYHASVTLVGRLASAIRADSMKCWKHRLLSDRVCTFRAIYSLGISCKLCKRARIFRVEPEERNVELVPLFLSAVRCFPHWKRCDNHSTRWTIIDRRLFTLVALTRAALFVSRIFTTLFRKKMLVIDDTVNHKQLFYGETRISRNFDEERYSRYKVRAFDRTSVQAGFR